MIEWPPNLQARHAMTVGATRLNKAHERVQLSIAHRQEPTERKKARVSRSSTLRAGPLAAI